MAFATKTRLSTDELLHSEVACNDVMELACRRPELKEELLKLFLEKSLVAGYTEAHNQLDDDPHETGLSNNHWDQLPLAFRPPPGLEDVMPMNATVPPRGHSLFAAVHHSDMVATPTAEAAPLGIQQQKKRQEEARSRTLVLAYLPRHAAEDDIAAAVDSAMGKQGCVHRARIVRDRAGTSECYGFFEFSDDVTATNVNEACRKGHVVIDDEVGHTWHVRASRARRAIVGAVTAGRKGVRGRRGRRLGSASSTPKRVVCEQVLG